MQRQGEFVITATGVEGSLIYALGASLRDALQQQGQAQFALNLLPGWSTEKIQAAIAHPRGSRSLSSHLKSRLGLDGVKLALLYELLSKEQMHDPIALAQSVQALPIALQAPRPLAEAISSAGDSKVRQCAPEVARFRPGKPLGTWPVVCTPIVSRPQYVTSAMPASTSAIGARRAPTSAATWFKPQRCSRRDA